MESFLLEQKKIAHRGFHNEQIPENSLAAFQKAIEKGYPIELDLHIIKDGTIIVFHDDNLKRMTEINKDVKDLEVSDLSTIYLKDSMEKIPTFSQVLKLINGQVSLVIELKYDVKKNKLDRAVAEILDNYHGEYVVKSFWPFSVLWWRIHRPEVKRGLLISIKDQKRYKTFLLEHLNWVLKPDFISYQVGFYNRKFIKKMRKKGIPVLFWTIYNKDEYHKASEFGNGYLVEKIEKW